MTAEKDLLAGSQWEIRPSVGGRIVLALIENAQKGIPEAVSPKRLLTREDLIRLQQDEDAPLAPRVNFGDLGDPATPSEITLFAFTQPAGDSGIIPVEY